MEMTLDEYREMRATNERLVALTLDMGRAIRHLDSDHEYLELWTLDGDYLLDGRFPK